MFIKKKLVEGYCQNCGEIKQGYKKTFRLGLYILITYITYMVLYFMSNVDQREFVVKLFFIAIAIGIGCKIYIFYTKKKKCFTCNRELID